MPSSRLMLFILMAALHLAPALVTPLNCDVFVLFRFLICTVHHSVSRTTNRQISNMQEYAARDKEHIAQATTQICAEA